MAGAILLRLIARGGRLKYAEIGMSNNIDVFFERGDYKVDSNVNLPMSISISFRFMFIIIFAVPLPIIPTRDNPVGATQHCDSTNAYLLVKASLMRKEPNLFN